MTNTTTLNLNTSKTDPNVRCVSFRTDSHCQTTRINHASQPSITEENQHTRTYLIQPTPTSQDSQTLIQVKPPSDTTHWFIPMMILNYTTCVGVCVLLAGIWLAISRGWMVRGLLAIVVALYAPSYFDKSEFKAAKGRRSERLTQSWSFWYQPMAWNQMEFIRTAPLNADQQYIFAIFPHGVAAMSRFFLTSPYFQLLFPNTRAPLQLATSLLMLIPFARELSLALGYIDASRKSANYALERGANISVYPGGVAEGLQEGLSDKQSVPIVRRDGFVRLALEYGTHLVPVAVIGEHKAYDCVPFPRSWVKFMYAAFKVPLQFALGYWHTWIPRPVPVTVVFGAPIEIPKIPNASREQVKHYADLYFTQYEALFRKHATALNENSNVCILNPNLTERE